MRNPRSCLLVVMTVVLAMVPQLAEAGPCSSDIAELEATLQLPGVQRLAPGQLSINVPQNQGSTSELAKQAGRRLQSQFSATVARAKRLDMHGDRVGCTGALNAARGMYVLVDKG